MTVVFECPTGVITDFGAAQPVLVEYADGDALSIAMLDRYGVWKRINGKLQVALVTDDLEQAKAEAMK